MLKVTRRAFLAAAAAVATMCRRPSPADPISDQEFLALSRRLTGRAALDPQIAAAYLGALLSVPSTIGPLAELARTPASATTPAHRAVEGAILENWYTGVYALGGERRVATHAAALMWAASGAPAPGVCAGEFGAWSRAPRPLT